MNDARRWRDAMRALGLEWRVGMVSDLGEVCVPCGDGLGLLDHSGCSVDPADDLSILDRWDRPDPHHPSNLGHLRDMAREVCASPDAHARPNSADWRIYCPMRRDLGTGDTEARAWLDALERKAREAGHD